MTWLLSVDPGIRACGCAMWHAGVLHAAALVENPSEIGAGPRECANMAQAVARWYGGYSVNTPVNTLAVEWPRTYGGRSSRGDASDLLPLAGVAGVLAAVFPLASVTAPHPHDWKGSIPKPRRASDPYIVEGRVLARLTEAERERIIWPRSKKLRTDVSDGIGIGLHALGRFAPRRGS